MMQGRIIKSVSGFCYVETADCVVECKLRGNLRKGTVEPLVGDNVTFSLTGEKGIIESLLPRKNFFIRPAVANLDLLVIFASNVIPVTDPFLIDRVTAIAGRQGVPAVICVNKSDLTEKDTLSEIYRLAGYPTLCTSAATGEGIEALRELISGKLVAFTGNSGVGKSSVLNRLSPALHCQVGEVSDKLGRGRHTTRQVELFHLEDGTCIADTPGFSSFDTERMELVEKDALASAFPEFAPYLGCCRYRDCSHRTEPDCALRTAVEQGAVPPSRYASYLRLYESAAEYRAWEHR